MAVLEKIRVKLGAFITVLIAVALLAFIVDPSTLESTIRVFSSKYDVGKIDGKSIRAEDFQAKVDELTKVYNLTTNSQSVSDQVMEQLRESAWQSLQNEMFVIPEIERAGIHVGQDELTALTTGVLPSPVIMQDPVFRDEQGAFSQERLNQFLSAVAQDESGNLTGYWNFLVDNVRQQQFTSKFTALLSNSNILNPVELRREVAENNVTSSIDFVMLPVGFETDSTITVTDAEIKSYYQKHINEYKQGASRDIEFVAYEAVPSEQDIQDAGDAIEKVFDEFCTTDNSGMKLFLSKNSDTPLSAYYYKKGELSSQHPEIDEFAFSANPGVLPVFKKENTYYAARVNDVRMMSDSAFVMHILLSADNASKADSLCTEASRGADFSRMASDWSLDTNPNVEHVGDLGWMTQNMMIPGMEAVLTMTPGSVKVMKTQYGSHVVKVTERTAPMQKVQVAILSKEASVSNATVKEYYSKANDLASKAEGKVANFDKVVAEENLPVVPVSGLLETAKRVSKYDNAREITRWAFDAKVGTVSNIITVDNRFFFVVALKGINEEGNIPVSKVAPSIKYNLMNEKKVGKLAADVAAKIAGKTDMEQVAEALGTTVSHNDGVAFGSITNPSFDPAFIGAVAAAQEGVVSGPVEGALGVYVFSVNSRDNGSFYTEDDARKKADQLLGYQLSSLSAIFQKMADIKDNRARFY